MRTSSNVFVDKTDTGLLDHYLVWFELGRILLGVGIKHVSYKWLVERLEDKTIRSFIFMLMSFQTLGDLHREWVTGEELLHRMASKQEKVVDKAVSITLGCKLIICG